MIAHCVFMNFSNDTTEADRTEVMRALGDLKSEIDGMIGYQYGPNRDFENKTPDHRHGFIITFRDKAALDAYAGNPRHQELGGRLVSMCVGGAEGILVYDIEFQPS